MPTSRGLIAVLAGCSVALIAIALARGARAETYTIQLTDEQIDSIIAGGAQCLERTPYACAAYAVFIRNLLQEARKPKPPPPAAPDPPK